MRIEKHKIKFNSTNYFKKRINKPFAPEVIQQVERLPIHNQKKPMSFVVLKLI